MATRSERSFGLRTAVYLPRQRKEAALDPFSITGLRGHGFAAMIATLVNQSRARHRLGPRVPKV